jgi:hypothetical protein
MADAIIPSVPARILSALAYLDDAPYTYSSDIADTDGCEVAAMLHLDGVLYAVWQPAARPECRIIQPAKLTVWVLDEGETPQTKWITIETGDNGEIKKIDITNMPISAIREGIGKSTE